MCDVLWCGLAVVLRLGLGLGPVGLAGLVPEAAACAVRVGAARCIQLWHPAVQQGHTSTGTTLQHCSTPCHTCLHHAASPCLPPPLAHPPTHSPPSTTTTTLQVYDVPGHTRGHIAYFSPQAKALLARDTLFALGCGRVFEGTHKQMWESLSKLTVLPRDTSVYCAHEYTQSNAR